MAKQQFFAYLQNKASNARNVHGMDSILDEIQHVKIPPEFDSPEPYEWCSGTHLLS